MKKAVFFQLTGSFAHFKFPFTSPNYLKKSFSIPPRTTILGILGSVLGINGFQQYEENEPEYYAKLKHIPITICVQNIPKKMLAVYNSLNSFAKNIPKEPMVNIKEEVLLNPKYKIGLILDEELETDKKLLESLASFPLPYSKYHIYLGKNEFFAQISNIMVYGENEFCIETPKSIEKLSSIIPSKYIDLSKPYEHHTLDYFSQNISFKNKELRSDCCEVVYFRESESENEIEFNGAELLKVGGTYYYLFGECQQQYRN